MIPNLYKTTTNDQGKSTSIRASYTLAEQVPSTILEYASIIQHYEQGQLPLEVYLFLQMSRIGKGIPTRDAS